MAKLKMNLIPGYTAKYNVHILVYDEVHETDVEAARREQRFKNPDRRALYEEICRWLRENGCREQVAARRRKNELSTRPRLSIHQAL